MKRSITVNSNLIVPKGGMVLYSVCCKYDMSKGCLKAFGSDDIA